MRFLLHAIQSLDLSVYSFLNGYAGNWYLDRLASHEETNNLFKGGMFFAFYIYFWFGAGPNLKKNRRAIILIIAGALLALVASRTIANIAPFRVRPMLAVASHPFSLPISLNMEKWSSFPSDTAAFFFALAYGVAHLARRYTVSVMFYTAAWICLPRMYLGEHYLSDIVVGALIGIAAVWASLNSEWLQTKLAERTLSFLDARPQLFYATAFLVLFEMGVLFNDVRHVARALSHLRALAP